MGSFFSAVVGGLTVVLVQHFILWRYQRRMDLKKAAFEDALTALSLYETDAMDVNLQKAELSEEAKKAGITPKLKLRDETNIAMAKALALTPAFFSKPTSDKFADVFSAGISLDNVPNDKYYAVLKEAMPMLAKEVDPPQFWEPWVEAAKKWYRCAYCWVTQSFSGSSKDGCNGSGDSSDK